MVLLDEIQDLTVDDVSLKQVIEIDHKRYAVLQVAESISFARMVIDENGKTGFEDIENEDEFKAVENFYKQKNS